MAKRKKIPEANPAALMDEIDRLYEENEQLERNCDAMFKQLDNVVMEREALKAELRELRTQKRREVAEAGISE